MLNWLRRTKPEAPETRSAGSGYTAQLLAARASYIGGGTGKAEITGTVQACLGLWEAALSAADVTGTDLLTRSNLALTARTLGLRGESVWVIGDEGLIPANDWDVTSKNGMPRAYRLSIPEVSGGRTETRLAAEVLHFRIGTNVNAPWAGTSPLHRASLSADMLYQVEDALAELYANAPLGSQIVPFPEAEGQDMDALGRGFRGKRGRVLLRESTVVSAAGGPAPQTDWKPQDVTPDIEKAAAIQSLKAARESIALAYGVLPALLDNAATGPLVREAQRHLAQWSLQPMAETIAEEVAMKTGGEVMIDLMRPMQAYDVGGRARALGTLVEAMARAKEAGIDLGPASHLVDFKE